MESRSQRFQLERSRSGFKTMGPYNPRVGNWDVTEVMDCLLLPLRCRDLVRL